MDHPGQRRVIVALGANVGDPPAQLTAAWAEVLATLELQHAALSPIFRSAPAEQARGPDFANAVGVGYTRRDAWATLAALQAIEAAFGRDRAAEGHHGPRRLDLDLVDWGGIVLEHPQLQLPHPRALRRPFVLLPLAAVAPDWCWPVDGRPLEALLEALATDAMELQPW